MKLVPMLKRKEENSLGEFIAGSHIFVGIRYFDGDKNFKYGLANCLWVFTNKLDADEAIYVQMMLAIESEEEKQHILNNPLNVSNFSDEEKEKGLKPVLSRMKLSENAFNSDFSFTIAENPKYYKFEVRASDNKTKIDTIRTVQIPEYMYFAISKLMYWLILTANVSISILSPPVCNKPIILRKIIGLTYDATTSANDNMMIAHFILYYNEGIHTDHIGVNVYIRNDKTRLVKHFITQEEFGDRVKDFAIYPDSVFASFTPKKNYYLKLGDDDMNEVMKNILYVLDTDTAKKIHWLDWDKYVYVNKEDK